MAALLEDKRLERTVKSSKKLVQHKRSPRIPRNQTAMDILKNALTDPMAPKGRAFMPRNSLLSLRDSKQLSAVFLCSQHKLRIVCVHFSDYMSFQLLRP